LSPDYRAIRTLVPESGAAILRLLPDTWYAYLLA
jgi:hypothetical protein